MTISDFSKYCDSVGSIARSRDVFRPIMAAQCNLADPATGRLEVVKVEDLKEPADLAACQLLMDADDQSAAALHRAAHSW